MPSSSPGSSTPSLLAPQTADGNLIGLLSVGFYSLFTLLPSSHSLMVSWPWVAVWQVALVLPIIWLLWQLWFKPLSAFKLGSGLDWPIALLVIGLAISTLFAEFPNQAIWYSWAALGGVAAIYALCGWLRTSHQAVQVLKFQAILGIAFILVSLGMWLSQTYFPELDRLAALEPYGVSQQFNFGITSLRNWYPLGHQNYVAGYLVLVLPLLFGLAIADNGWQRWLWGSACFLGLVDLYTASSRGGLLALVATVAIALIIALFRAQLPRRLVLPTGCLILCILVATTLGNSRVRRPVLALLQGKTNNSELGYRIITNVIGWRIGIDHPFTGAAPGSVLQLYQKYRPYWAGREAELHFQLHSTPAQLWAELGLWGIAALVSIVGLLVWLTWRWSQQNSESWLAPTLVWSLVAGLFAYGLMGLTDYQLDTPAISGALIVDLVVLAKVYQPPNQQPLSKEPTNQSSSKVWVGLGIGLLLAITLWLVPVHRAWAISKQGFQHLERGNFDGFEAALTQANQLAPWEPYYPSMLAWTLGDFSYQTTGESSAALRNAAIEWFEKANAVAPYQEFGQSNLGWLLLQTKPDEAVKKFANAATLVPAKQGIFFGLGQALVTNGQPEEAADAFASEILRFPMVMTSPIWEITELSNIQGDVFSQLKNLYSQFLNDETALELKQYWQQMRGTLNWWQNNNIAATKDWQNFSTGQVLLKMSQSNPNITVQTLPEKIIGRSAMLAWIAPEERLPLFEKVSIQTQDQLPKLNATSPTTKLIEQLVTTMENSNSFNDWLKRNVIVSQPRSQRLGFGVLNRHIDGPHPSDYYTRVVNQQINLFFKSMFITSTWAPELDKTLQPFKNNLLKIISQS
ncbi:O-antigen ligase family protein [Leptothoe kymatousa]|uniref:O-antigen ligase family protein n=1 Tax=Leptothoe kymatousa TAU-MAC 1615 TaxID=2364775 RepID=A0ABS5Y0M1_9CYAN|nr:O-antigen ligase family protein [Leptothoe kymatousa]MBT9311361.1 O-antigen ligase family protein [Leptothoe kymatousa TAU-MAC 1615]